jgi:hypothetical protein
VKDDPLGCVGWAHCVSCGGVCSTDDMDDRPYKTGLKPQVPREPPHEPGDLSRYRNYRREKKT